MMDGDKKSAHRKEVNPDLPCYFKHGMLWDLKRVTARTQKLFEVVFATIFG